ncbi:hypothetical protein Aph02nite_62930 [Actinoplanes philippinensis]|uniref:DUF3558 domain-containing protein n=1 Tax=Actinoplanes philippinensis TaxID=35752 RepID=A0A1I2JNB3_9ACTN|nr:hypothetical protein [Actinoplanes philippinensis]GIE80343.1 hypothetical protein Aph02nite_62930 [Actinoplanes philippinensis]SFF56322.1 hypothetical protein SAMN05421541_113155 [Actinoplanes philippinensis]
MPTRLAALGAAVLFAVAGCSSPADESATIVTPPSPAEDLAELPAASAGGACILWDYDFIEQNLGVRFAVAAADQVDDTSTCVVQTLSAPWPDLALSVVETTKANATIFLDTRMPEKATKLTGLGKAGYRMNTKASGEHGPTVEIGWLSEAKQLQTLRFTFAKDATAADVKDMNAKLLELAKALSTTNG